MAGRSTTLWLRIGCRYDTHEEALASKNYLTGCKVDERDIRIDMDGGFEEGRQCGRSATGGQVRDQFRKVGGEYWAVGSCITYYDWILSITTTVAEVGEALLKI
jgi:hypothetical protein